MKKIYFLITLLFGFSIGLFIFSYQEVKAQVGTGNQCYAGTWMQPTCNPVTSDPSSCNILPPLFSGAACDQHTGYLRVQDEANGTAQANWTQLFPGKILVGDVAGGWVTPGGSIEIYGPVVSGNFALATDVPVGFKESGDFAAQRDIYAGGSLRVAGNSSFYGSINAYNRVNITASANTGNLMTITNSAGIGTNATTVAIIQTPGSVGNILSLDTADNNRVYVDQLGYLNATKDFQIRIDTDNNFTQNYFRINDGANATVFQVAEDGSAQIAGDASVAKNLSAGSIVANSPSAGRGKIWGNFTDLNNNNCSADQLLVYRGAPFTPGWYCVSATNVGTTTVGNLLQTLQAGADASSFAGAVSIGTDSNGFTLVGPEVGVSGPVNFIIKNRENVNLNNQLMGAIYFSDAYNFISQAKIEVARGASGSGGDYPTKMSFWTTPDGSSVAQERLTILANGNVGIGNTFPNSKLNINVPVNTEGIKIVNNNYSPLVIRNNADVFDLFRVNETGNVTAYGTIRGRFTDGDGNLCANNQILVYNSGTSKWVCSNSIPGGSQDLLSVLGAGSNASTYTANTSIGGNLGLGGISNPTYSIHLSKSATSNGYGSLALETAATGRNSYIEIRNSDTSQIPYIDLTKGWTGGNTPDFSGRIAYWSDNDFQIIQANNNPLSFWTNNTKRMTIAGNGFVGIGIDPTSMFQINGAAGTGWNSGLKITRADQIGADFRINVTTGDTLFRNFSAGTGYAFRNSADASLLNILSDGKVGIGYNPPTSKLTVGPTNNVEGVRIISSNYSPLIIRNTANDKDIFRIKQNGELTHFINGSPAMSMDTNLVLSVNNKVKTNIVETQLLTHYEDTGTNSTYYTWGDDGLDFCGSGPAYLDCQDTKLARVIFDYISNFFKISQALAEPVREFENSAPTNAAPCNVGDVTLYTAPSQPKIYFNCSDNWDQTAPYISYRLCQATTSTPSEVTKIQFEGTPGLAKPGLTKVKDNLVVEQNLWGNGITSGCHNVGTSGVPTKQCPDGEFMAGINIVTNMYDSTIICCPL